MQVRQFEDKYLSQFSYAILSDCEKKIVIVDPARNPQPYLDFAREHNAQITGIIETHPHADFVSSHLELHQLTGATIYTSEVSGVFYPHQPFDDNDSIDLGKIKLRAINTPGHSPDSICVLLEHGGKQHAVFTGDTLFVGDCGRPDLREGAGKLQQARKVLAAQMYSSLRNKLGALNDDVIVYPGHGAGSLCGKTLSDAVTSTIKEEKQTNWCLQEMTQDAFITNLLDEQPFVPAYFPYDVELNRKGAPAFSEATNQVKLIGEISTETQVEQLNKELWVVDVRDQAEYKKGHLPHAVNIMEGERFETWLGSIIKPEESFYLAAGDEQTLREMIARTASIGYEALIMSAFVVTDGPEKDKTFDIGTFRTQPSAFTVIDVRNENEVKQQKVFENSIPIPLHELRNRLHEIPVEKPVVVHCAGGYRSAAASSLISSSLNGKVKVADLGEKVKTFLPAASH
jgi:glyoxylase-like metal-dependent hydrolase (beta-lactamase superfamily II)/rhodanese-related sulfurtransferase